MVTRITTRQEFGNYCLRKIGFPVLEINMDEDQVNDRIDEALRKFQLYHYDGHEKIYFVHEVTAQDHINKFIKLPENIIGVVRILPISSAFNVGSVFSLQYQIVLQDMWRWSSVQLTQFYQIYQYTQLIEQLLVGQQPLRFNERNNRLYLDMEWGRIPVGNFIIVEAYRTLDPDEVTLTLNDLVGTFQDGEIITGGTSGATATIEYINKQSVSEIFISNWNFLKGETITGGTSGATATVSEVFDARKVWENPWLLEYATALIEENFAVNLSKYDNPNMPGGIKFNGERIYARAQEKLQELKNDLYTSFMIPSIDMIG